MSHHLCAPDLGAGSALCVIDVHSLLYFVFYRRLEKTPNVGFNLSIAFGREEQ
jgi:hypothetical protein